MNIRPFKCRSIDPTEPVRVHRNLHNGLYSVVQHGLVVAHAAKIVLSDCVFVVNQAGRERVLRDKRKNVHAFVVGFLATNQNVERFSTRVSYNPYKNTTFVRPEGPVTVALAVCITTFGETPGGPGVYAEDIA